MTSNVTTEKRRNAVWIRINRPEVRNALDDVTREQLEAAVSRAADDADVAAIVITGAGAAFCAGGDIRGMRERMREPAEARAAAGWRRQRRTARFISAVHGAAPITVAAVNGPAVGLGLDLALACDFIVGSPTAQFAASFVQRGLIPDGGGLYFLPRRIGLQVAKDMIFTGRTVSATEALAIGLADRLSESNGLEDSVNSLLAGIDGHSPTAIALMKSIVNRSFELDLASVAALGAEAQAICYTTAEHQTSVNRFLNRATSTGNGSRPLSEDVGG